MYRSNKSPQKIKEGQEMTNQTNNPLFSEVAARFLSRRRFLQMGALAGTAAATPVLLSACGGSDTDAVVAANPTFPAAMPSETFSRAVALGFKNIEVSREDSVRVPPGYSAKVLYSWGDPIGAAGLPAGQPAYRPDGSNSAAEQALQAGMHHDGIAWFSLPFGSQNIDHGLLAMNHEAKSEEYLLPKAIAWEANERCAKAKNAMGVSVIEIKKVNDQWQVVRPSSFARRITPDTPMTITGPAAGHQLMQTQDDPEGTKVLGTMQNCANGFTPWGTYLTCEENWAGIFANEKSTTDANEKRYGVSGKGDSSYTIDPRFVLTDNNPNEANRFGWVVEIDPYEPNSVPRKLTALGRFAHEGAAITVADDGRIVAYMGDDQRHEYIYKFVSEGKYDPAAQRSEHMRLLEKGTLYVARFDEDGSGVWLPLVFGQHGLDTSNGFADQGEVLIKTRLAADVLGATPMDRPEWTAVDPYTPGSVYCTLTNNTSRKVANAANPRVNNAFGHIIHWQEAGQDATALTFTWDILVLAGYSETFDENLRGSMNGAAFGSPDGLAFDHRGVLWIQTDYGPSTTGVYANMGHCMMVATVPGTNEYRRFLTGPIGCEITGITFTPDNKNVFINIQHPEGKFPDGPESSRPRCSTVVISKDDGGLIGE